MVGDLDLMKKYDVVLGLSKYTIWKLFNELHTLKGTGFHFSYKYFVGLIKVISSAARYVTTNLFTRFLDGKLYQMGISIPA